VKHCDPFGSFATVEVLSGVRIDGGDKTGKRVETHSYGPSERGLRWGPGQGLTVFEGPNMTLLTQMRCMTGVYLFYGTAKVRLAKL
jgi:hypothetical protein